MRKITLVLLVFSLLVGLAGSAAGAKRATVVGTLLDGDGTPIEGVDVTIRGAEFEQVVSTDSKGHFKVTVPDAAAEYEIAFAREGLPVYSEPLTFEKGGVLRRDWTMNVTAPESITDSLAALSAFNAGARAHNDGEFDLALQKFGEAVAEDPEFLEAHVQIAGIHKLRKDHELASSSAARVLALDPDHVGALRILYDAESELGRDSANATLDRLAELDPGPTTAVHVYNDGVAARVAGDRERARVRYELATRLNPSLVQAHVGLAGVLLESKEYDAALVSSVRAIELAPQDARANSIRYNTLIAMGRNDEAKAALEDLQRVAPKAVAQAYFERGTLLFDEGHIEPATSALERAVAADPQFARAHYTLGLCYMNGNRNADARRHLETFLELAPGDPDADSSRRLVEVLSRSE